MVNFAADTLNKFSAFLTENEKEIRNQNSPYILHFAVNLEDGILPDPLKLTALFDLSLYYEKPAEDFSFSALGACLEISENGSGRFPSTIKKIKEWQNNFISNINIDNNPECPLFTGGIKFSNEHSEEAWKEFSDSVWFLPDYLIFTKNKRKQLIINLIVSAGTSASGIIKKFETKLNSLLLIKVKEERKNGSFKVLNTQGDTPKDKKKWKQMVEAALEEIDHGEFEKVVLSRKIELLFSEELNVYPLHEKLKNIYSNCYSFIFKRGGSYFFGASPERLASFHGGDLTLEALAGSASIGKDQTEKESNKRGILFNGKNMLEHKYVVEHIVNGVREFADDIKLPAAPDVKELPNIMHLATEIRAELKENTQILAVIEKIFPTPAVCGSPAEKALNFIKKNENHQRGLYSGLIGWFNFLEEGEFVISIRSALLNGKRLYAFAGCGIVRESDPAEEFAETNLKLEPILSLFR